MSNKTLDNPQKKRGDSMEEITTEELPEKEKPEKAKPERKAICTTKFIDD